MQVKDTGSNRRAEVALTRAYVPIVRGYLIASSVYYALISLSHPFYEKGLAFWLLESLAVAACLYGFAAWRALKGERIVGPSPSVRAGHCNIPKSNAARAASSSFPQAAVPRHGINGPSQETFTVLHCGAATAQLGRASPCMIQVSPASVLR